MTYKIKYKISGSAVEMIKRKSASTCEFNLIECVIDKYRWYEAGWGAIGKFRGGGGSNIRASLETSAPTPTPLPNETGPRTPMVIENVVEYTDGYNYIRHINNRLTS